MSETNVFVACRFRPLLTYDEFTKNGQNFNENAPNSLKIQISDSNSNLKLIQEDNLVFECRLNHVFDVDTTQDEIFQRLGKPLIHGITKGLNSTIFAYGQSGSGKSYSVFGEEGDYRGLTPRCCEALFAYIEEEKLKNRDVDFKILLSCVEIYCEDLFDLLNASSNSKGKRKKLKIREHPERGVYIEGLRYVEVNNHLDIVRQIELASKTRMVAGTHLNPTSSRSHCLFTLHITRGLSSGSSLHAKFNLADLGGSENIKKTGVTGQTLKEAKKINLSLSTLRHVIHLLSEEKNTYIPFRDSKLTFILRESFGGNCRSVLLATCSPHSVHLHETISTLRFAEQTACISNVVRVNAQLSYEELTRLVKELKEENMSIQRQLDMVRKREVRNSIMTTIMDPERVMISNKQESTGWEQFLIAYSELRQRLANEEQQRIHLLKQWPVTDAVRSMMEEDDMTLDSRFHELHNSLNASNDVSDLGLPDLPILPLSNSGFTSLDAMNTIERLEEYIFELRMMMIDMRKEQIQRDSDLISWSVVLNSLLKEEDVFIKVPAFSSGSGSGFPPEQFGVNFDSTPVGFNRKLDQDIMYFSSPIDENISFVHNQRNDLTDSDSSSSDEDTSEKTAENVAKNVLKEAEESYRVNKYFEQFQDLSSDTSSNYSFDSDTDNISPISNGVEHSEILIDNFEESSSADPKIIFQQTFDHVQKAMTKLTNFFYQDFVNEEIPQPTSFPSHIQIVQPNLDEFSSIFEKLSSDSDTEYLADFYSDLDSGSDSNSLSKNNENLNSEKKNEQNFEKSVQENEKDELLTVDIDLNDIDVTQLDFAALSSDSD
eukprot:TRINITY_DN3227_c3_g2_i1.p1 TRINITY_DN3227_c3_g2~~TRINITY_DN3227_c3_g2_i1.p1  ORF type:complete len:828 (-),score=228.36 TRINITY_DN3227_c3_g2_i1:759-3242(-)